MRVRELFVERLSLVERRQRFLRDRTGVADEELHTVRQPLLPRNLDRRVVAIADRDQLFVDGAELRQRPHQHPALNRRGGIGGAGVGHQSDERVRNQRVEKCVAEQDLLARQVVHRPCHAPLPRGAADEADVDHAAPRQLMLDADRVLVVLAESCDRGCDS